MEANQLTQNSTFEIDGETAQVTTGGIVVVKAPDSVFDRYCNSSINCTETNAECNAINDCQCSQGYLRHAVTTNCIANASSDIDVEMVHEIGFNLTDGCDTDIEISTTEAYLRMRQSFLIMIHSSWTNSEHSQYFIGVYDVVFTCIPESIRGKRAILEAHNAKVSYKTALDSSPTGQTPLSREQLEEIADDINVVAAETGIDHDGERLFGFIFVPTVEPMTTIPPTDLWVAPTIAGIVAGLVFLGAVVTVITVVCCKRRAKKPSVHRYGTLQSLHPALRFHSTHQLAGHTFASSFGGSMADTDSTSSTDSFKLPRSLPDWPGAIHGLKQPGNLTRQFKESDA